MVEKAKPTKVSDTRILEDRIAFSSTDALLLSIVELVNVEHHINQFGRVEMQKEVWVGATSSFCSLLDRLVKNGFILHEGPGKIRSTIGYRVSEKGFAKAEALANEKTALKERLRRKEEARVPISVNRRSSMDIVEPALPAAKQKDRFV